LVRHTPSIVHQLIALLDSEDERVAVVACNSILDRAFGKPKGEEMKRDSIEERSG
jgi:hypothetical protein